MTPQKKPTVPQLLRKIERLEAQVAQLKAMAKHDLASRNDWLCEAVDAKMRIKQATAILNGSDE